MNIFRVTASKSDVNSCGPYTRYAAGTLHGEARLNEYIEYLVSEGYSNFNVEDYNDCAGCGHSKRDHFNDTGVCDLGFCSKRCSDYVTP